MPHSPLLEVRRGWRPGSASSARESDPGGDGPGDAPLRHHRCPGAAEQSPGGRPPCGWASPRPVTLLQPWSRWVGPPPPAAAEQANACLIEVFDEDGHRGYLLDLVWLSRRALLPLLHHDVPLCIRARAPLLPPLRPSPPPAAAAASPSAASRSSAAALRAWGSLPSLPPAAAAPRLPRVRAARPPPAAPPLLTRPPPLHADPLETLFPFLGDFSGASWNTQAIFARKRQRHADKVAYVGTLAKNHDFVALTDTHGLEGATVAWTCPPGCRSWFSPGTTRRGGIGIVVRESFLRQFQAVEPRWIHVVPGRAAVLQLRGHGGALDIHVVYSPRALRGWCSRGAWRRRGGTMRM